MQSLDIEIPKITQELSKMGREAASNLKIAVRSFADFDSTQATQVVKDDMRLDQWHADIDQNIIELLATLHPVASDLRKVLAVQHMASDIERIGDYAKNIAKRTMIMEQPPSADIIPFILKLGSLCESNLMFIMDVITKGLPQNIHTVVQREEEIDTIYDDLFHFIVTNILQPNRKNEKTHALLSPASGLHILFVGKNLERVGDYTANMLKHLIFMEHGVATHSININRS